MIIPNVHEGNGSPAPILAVGLDIETTSLHTNRGLLSIGVYTEIDGDCHSFYGEMRPHADAVWSYKSSEINGFQPESIRRAPDDYTIVDFSLCDSFAEIFNDDRWVDVRPVGFNVDGFDMATVKRFLPNFAMLFSHRCIELNSAALVLTNIFGVTKNQLKNDVEASLGEEAQWHNAYYDAMISYKILGEILAYKNGTL